VRTPKASRNNVERAGILHEVVKQRNASCHRFSLALCERWQIQTVGMPIRAKYVHTNLIARDWKKLVHFYSEVFGCNPKGPERDLSAAWLDRVNSVPNARLRGVHLRLPGYDDDGPTLEIFSYDQLIERGLPRANECGFGHIAFAVDDVDEALQAVIAAGGGAVGEVATAEVKGVGLIRLVYARDPEGNIVELQKWT
jgi:predicted enzyme related to lactoylglutathione lyase